MHRRLRGSTTILASPPRQRPDAFLERILDALSAGLCEIGEALASGEIVLDGGLVRIAGTRTQSLTPKMPGLSGAMTRILNETAFTELLPRVDSATEYSTAILGKAPRSTRELSDLYAALLVHGTAIDTSVIARMFPHATLDGVPRAMRMLANRERLRKANERVVAYLCSHANGPECAGPMLTTRSARLALGWRLWKAAHDPRHHRHAVQAYARFIERHGIPRELPVVAPYRRIRQALAPLLRRHYGANTANPAEHEAALDNGLSAIVIAKLLGFDVFTPLDVSTTHRLWVPAGTAVPPSLAGAVTRGVSLPAIRKGWHGLVRLAHLAGQGATRAELRGHVHQGGASCRVAHRHLGRLIRTLHSCACLSNAAFRSELEQFFSEQHSLERLRQAVYRGPYRRKAGGTKSIPASSDETLTLLTNIVLVGSAICRRTLAYSV